MAVRFFDGETAIGHAATVLIESSGLLIRIPGGGEDQFWAFWTLHWKDGPDGNEVVLSAHGAGTARLVIDDPELLAELAQRMGRRWKPGGRTRRPLAFTAALACASLLAGWIIMVRLPEWVAPLVPLAWQDRLAEAAAVALSSHRVCSGTEGQAAIDALETKLVQAARIPGEVTITVVDDPDVNAFALPGNRIVVLRGLIDTAKDGDELAGIL
ncbi:MAG: M48 family metalloprotease, partial [Candidatus Methylacidiphilaceae bacterium]